MLQTLVVTLREGVEIALVMGIVLAYLKRIERPELGRWAWGGFVLALPPSLAAAWYLPNLIGALGVNEEAYEGTIMLLAAAMVGTLLVWMWRTGRQFKARMEGKMDALARGGAAGWGIGLLTFLTVFREGAELFVFLEGMQFSTEKISQVEGFLFGATLAALFGVAFLRGTVRIDLGKFFAVTSVFLGFLILQLVGGGIHEYSEVGILPSSKAEMALIGPIVNDTGGHLYLFGGVLLAALLWVSWPARAAAAATASVTPAANPAEVRKQAATLAAERRWRHALAGLGGACALFLIGCSFHFAPPARPEAEALTPTEGNAVSIPTARLEDGGLRFYRTATAAGELRFMALKLGEGRYAVALDACQICGPEGYFAEGETLICRHCGAPIQRETVGAAGGCNPIHVTAEARDGALWVHTSDLEKAWKVVEDQVK
ncbi:MAG: DUF2318 domain-containing protein [Planctomycetes bacterium]|nr:DUF2318 domain-containing protein [Planctomycetota bacterium]